MKRIFITLILLVILAVIFGCSQVSDKTQTRSTSSNTKMGSGEWILQNPLPSGEPVLSVTPDCLVNVWGTSYSDVFAVGTGGVIVHYDGNKWSNMDSGINYELYDIWGNSPHDIFAVGDKGTIIHYDGIGWSSMDSGTEEILIEVGGSSTKDVFTISNKGTIFLYDGISWRTAEYNLGRNLMCWDAWGSSSSDIFIPTHYLGEITNILHFDGIGWLPMNSGHTDKTIGCMWGSSPTEIYAGVESGTIIYFNGSQWNTLLSGAETWFFGIWASSPSDIFAVGFHGTIMHYDGTEWTIMYNDDSLSLRGVWGSSSGVFAVGSEGTILYYSKLSNELIFS